MQRFVAGSRNQTAEQIQRLGNVTQVLVDNRMALENVLHIAPNAIANFYNIYYPNGGSVTGAFSVANFSNPVWFVCGMIGGVANTTAPETAKLCAQYLGPALRLLNFNEPAVPDQRLPAARGQPGPAHLHRSEARARRCRAAVTAPEPPPSVSAYTGAGDVPPPPGWNATARPAGNLRARQRRDRDTVACVVPGGRRFRGRPTSCRTFLLNRDRRRDAAAADPGAGRPAATTGGPNAPLLPAEGTPPS